MPVAPLYCVLCSNLLYLRYEKIDNISLACNACDDAGLFSEQEGRQGAPPGNAAQGARDYGFSEASP